MNTLLAAGLGLTTAGAAIGLLVAAREIRGPRHTRTGTAYAGFHNGPINADAQTSTDSEDAAA